ncbi:MAG: hypothetical protein ACR2Q3_15930, partial [Woeseiaceae bacterium]
MTRYWQWWGSSAPLGSGVASAVAVIAGVLLLSFASTSALAQSAPLIVGQTPNPLPTDEETPVTIECNNLAVIDLDSTYPIGCTRTVEDGTNYTRSGNTITPVQDFNGNLTLPVSVNDGLLD